MAKIITIPYILLVLCLLAVGTRGAQIGKSNPVSKTVAIEDGANIKEQIRSNDRADSIENEDDIEKRRVKRFFPTILENVSDFVAGVPKLVFAGLSAPFQIFKGGLEFGLDAAAKTARKWIPISPDFNPLGIFDHEKEKCGMIILQGLGIKFPPSILAKTLSPALFGIRRNCVILAPTAPSNPTDKVPFATFMSRMDGIGDLNLFRSWYNFKKLPAELVQSYNEFDESKEDLEESLSIVEANIKSLINRGVPSRNIVLMGFSQGGAMTIYTAIHTKYKIGGFIPVIAWMPRRLVEPVTHLPTPVNRDTPILQINGKADAIVEYYPAGQKTKEDMQKVFTKYKMVTFQFGSHATTPGSFDFLNRVRDWLRENTDITS